MPEVSSFDIILELCRDLVSQRVEDALTEMLEKADEALTAYDRQSRDPESSKLYKRARGTVLSQREALVTQFRKRFLREFQERCNQVKKIGDKFADVDLSSFGQEMAAEYDLNESLKFDAMVSRLRQYCEEELLALDQRIGVLVGDADLQDEDNPLAPQAIVDAYKHTCRQIDPDVDVQMVLLRLFDDYVLDEIRSVYKAANALLIEHSILPKIRRGKDGVKAQTGGPMPVEHALGNVSGLPVAELIPQELTNTNLGGGLNQMDTMASDIMATLFDDLFEGRKVPTIVKELIGRLQTPMIKLAIADKSFFSRKNHPARQLLDELGEFSAHLPVDISDSDPVYRKLESLIGNVIDGSAEDINIFDHARQQLDTLLAELNDYAEEEGPPVAEVENERQHAAEIEEEVQYAAEVEKEVPPVARQADQAEKLARAKSVAEAEIKARVRATAPQLILRFLVKQWGKVLVVVYVREGETSSAWKGALETADVLLWTGEPKETIEDRQKMVAIVPGLLKRITAGLNYAGIDDAIRVQFLSDLRKLHAKIVGKMAQPSAKVSGEDAVDKDESSEAREKAIAAKPATVEQNEASDRAPDVETVTSIAEPDEAEANGMAGEADAIPMPGESDQPETGQEIRLDYLPTVGGAATNVVPADTAVAKEAKPGEKAPMMDSPSEESAFRVSPPAEADPNADAVPPLEFETDLLKAGEQDAVPDEAEPFADSTPPLEFESGLAQSDKEEAAPVDVEALVNSLPSLEFEVEAEAAGKQGAATTEPASDAESLPAEDRDGHRSAEAEVYEALDRVLTKEPEPERKQSIARLDAAPPPALRAEMDQAMEATRTMFSDVDRFIILGQIRNATNLLESRIKHEPADRESWIKLMAIYRDEGMEGGFNRTYAAFCEKFGENADA